MGDQWIECDVCKTGLDTDCEVSDLDWNVHHVQVDLYRLDLFNLDFFLFDCNLCY